jgi:exodeoxyribonuclease VII small subunit
MASKNVEDGFETLYRQLEETVSRLEDGGLTLEESLAAYEAGMKLANRCQELLQQAELKVTKLQESFADGLNSVREEASEYSADLDPAVSQDELPLE